MQDNTSTPAAGVPAGSNLDLIDEFIMQADVGQSSCVKYRTHLTEFEAWVRQTGCAAGNLVGVRRADVLRFMAYLRSGDRFASSGHHRVGKGELSSSTRRTYHSSLSRFYRYLVTVELVSSSPVTGVDAPKARHTPGLRLTADEVRRLLEDPGEPRERVQVFLLTFTGAREHEIRGLRWQDVDFMNQTMMVHGKGDKYRVIDIHPRLMTELRRWYLYQEDYASTNPKVRAAKAEPATDFVLLTNRGRQLCHSVMIKQLKRRAARAGLYLQTRSDGENVSAIHPHALRRTFGTLLLNDGHHLDAVADVLGHRSLDTTRKHYAFSSNERRRATIRGFNV